MNIGKLFTEHPSSVGESYLEHMRMATGFALAMGVGALAVLVHAFLPFLFVRTGSRQIERLYCRMVTNRTNGSRLQSPALKSSGTVSR